MQVTQDFCCSSSRARLLKLTSSDSAMPRRRSEAGTRARWFTNGRGMIPGADTGSELLTAVHAGAEGRGAEEAKSRRGRRVAAELRRRSRG